MVRPYMDVDEIAIEGRKNLVLMDNNILAAGDYAIEQLNKLIKRGYKVDFNQALDARLVTDEFARLLAKVKWLNNNRIRFGCHTHKQIDDCERAIELLEHYGYHQYEISNFAANGFESRHNLKYWQLGDYMGFGPGAHSAVGNQRYSYVKDLRRYISGVQHKQSIVDELQIIDPLERAVEYVMLGMRTTHGISEWDYRIHTQSDWRPIVQTLMAFQQKGWAVEENGRWHFTVPGFLISNTLISILLEAQASGRIEGTPWLQEAYEAEEKILVPKSEEELFTELYQEDTQSTKEVETSTRSTII
jgi:hypothetical protein